MKKIIVILILLFGAFLTPNCDAQTYYYKTYQFAIKYRNNGVWGDWSGWERSNMTLKIDLDEDLIIIYSEKKQIYSVVENLGSYIDDSGGKQIKFYVIDQDGDNGYVRLRVEKNGNQQLYVDFNNVMWVYNVRQL